MNDYGCAAEKFHQFFKVKKHKSKEKHLQAILQGFSHFPYENLSKIVKYSRIFEGAGKIRLPDEVMEDYVQYRLGGTCFSLTHFLQAILEHEGYLCYPVMADMHWGRNVHCALIVQMDGQKNLVDPGYCLNQPLPLPEKMPVFVETEVSAVRCEYRPESAEYHVYTINQNEERWRYRFKDVPVGPDAFLSHWLASFTWNSMHGFCLTHVDNGSMVYLHKHYVRETKKNAKKSYKISDVSETIEKVFSIPPEYVRDAGIALEENMAREIRLGLFAPEEKKHK